MNVSVYLDHDGQLRVIPRPGEQLPEVKEMGGTWDERARGFKLPALRTNVLQVIEAVGREHLDMQEDVLRIGDGHGFTPIPEMSLNLKTLAATNGALYPYQWDAIQYLVSNPHGTLLNVSPGLGKTAIAVVAAEAFFVSRALIVAPASLLFTWEREIHKWAPAQEVTISHGLPPFTSGWVITTYDMVAQHKDWFNSKWDLLILDETVLIKNRATRRFKAIAALRKKVPKVWMLSGNPTTRFADDLWTQMHLAYPAAFKSYWRFAERFCVLQSNIWSTRGGKEVVGTRASRDISWELGDLMLTINQEDVLDLPEYLFEVVDVPLTKAQERAFTTMAKDFLIELGGRELTADNKLAQLLRLQQVVAGMANFWGTQEDMGGSGASAKEDALVDLIEAQAYAFPMLVWTHWDGSAEHLTRRLCAQQINAARVSGKTGTKTRDDTLQAFTRGEIDVLVISLGVGKFGHTLTSARTVVYFDKTWAADDYIQSLRRVRRIGLKHRPVLLTLRSPRTTDDLIELNLANKMPSISKVTNSQLQELLRGLGL